MMKETRTYTYKKVNIKDGKVKLTTSDAFDNDVFMVFCVWRCSSTNEWKVGDTVWLWIDIILRFNYERRRVNSYNE